MRLDPADIEQIAQQVADLIVETQTGPSGQYVDAAQLAQLLGVERDWVYAHANALGAIRLGGPAAACGSTFNAYRPHGPHRPHPERVRPPDAHAKSAHEQPGPR
jgi:hypothetical protein